MSSAMRQASACSVDERPFSFWGVSWRAGVGRGHVAIAAESEQFLFGLVLTGID